MCGVPRFTELERAITKIALAGLAAAVLVGAAIGFAIDRLIRGD